MKIKNKIYKHRKVVLHGHVALHTVYWVQAAFTTSHLWSIGLYAALALLTVVVSVIEEDRT